MLNRYWFFGFKQRLRAALLHLAGSAILALFALLLVYGVWYPAGLSHAVGVDNIVLLLLAVDVVLGPLLTFAIYQIGKKTLRFDLCVIVVIQLAAFIWGVWKIAEGRPAWLVFNVDRFDLVQAHEVDDRHPDRIPEAYRSPSWWSGPRWVAALPPASIEERNRLTLEAALAGVDLPQRADLYQPLEVASDAIRQHALPVHELNQFNDAQTVEKTLQRWPEADAFLPMMARVQPMTVLLKKDQAKVVAIVDLWPWEK